VLCQESQLYIHCNLENDQPETIPIRCMWRCDVHDFVEVGDLTGSGPAAELQDESGDGLQNHLVIVSRAARQAQIVEARTVASY
jgi:hypothetical protein